MTLGRVKGHAPLSFCRQTTRACAPCVQKGTWVVCVRESPVKTVGWWRVWVRAQDLNEKKKVANTRLSSAW